MKKSKPLTTAGTTEVFSQLVGKSSLEIENRLREKLARKLTTASEPNESAESRLRAKLKQNYASKSGAIVENRLREKLVKNLNSQEHKNSESGDIVSAAKKVARSAARRDKPYLYTQEPVEDFTLLSGPVFDEADDFHSKNGNHIKSVVVVKQNIRKRNLADSDEDESPHPTCFRVSSVVKVVKNSDKPKPTKNLRHDSGYEDDHDRSNIIPVRDYYPDNRNNHSYRCANQCPIQNRPASNVKWHRPGGNQYFKEWTQDYDNNNNLTNQRRDLRNKIDNNRDHDHNDGRSRSKSVSERHRSLSASGSDTDKQNDRKDMPEHIKWLHERWTRYDHPNIFSKSRAPLKPADLVCEVNKQQRDRFSKDLNSYTSWRDEKNSSATSRNNNTPSGPSNRSQKSTREWDLDKHQDPAVSDIKSDYMNWRYGGVNKDDLPHMLSFKEFLLSLPNDVDDSEQEQTKAIKMFNEYKLKFKGRIYREFFEEHKDEEWFLQKYHPYYKTQYNRKRREIVQRRLDIFMSLLVKGWIEIHVEFTDSRKIRKLFDAVCVLLQGGMDRDILQLSDFDYVVEEKRETSYELARQTEELELASAAAQLTKPRPDDGSFSGAFASHPGLAEAMLALPNIPLMPSIENSDNPSAQLEYQAALCELLEEHRSQVKKAMDLEVAQHARDYSVFVKEHAQQVSAEDANNEEGGGEKDEAEDATGGPKIHWTPDNMETRYIGNGVFIQRPKLFLDQKKPVSETDLHRNWSLCIMNISPKVTKAEIEELCMKAHGCFMRLFMSPPDPNNGYKRFAIASFPINANVQRLCWTLRSWKMPNGQPLEVLEYRDFQKRIEFIDGLASDKSIVLRDVQLCKNLIEYLDRRHGLWANAEQNDSESDSDEKTDRRRRRPDRASENNKQKLTH